MHCKTQFLVLGGKILNIYLKGFFFNYFCVLRNRPKHVIDFGAEHGKRKSPRIAFTVRALKEGGGGGRHNPNFRGFANLLETSNRAVGFCGVLAADGRNELTHKTGPRLGSVSCASR